MDLKLNITDIIPLENCCWEKSFEKVKSNLKAMYKRGQNTLNYNLLLDKDILPVKPSTINLIDFGENSPMNCTNDKLNNNGFQGTNLSKINLKLDTSKEYARQ